MSGGATPSRPEWFGSLAGLKVLIIVENLPVPFDRRVWQEARTLCEAGAKVVIVCPIGKGFERRYETLEGIHIYRHPLPPERSSAIGYVLEYGAALFWESWLAWKILFRHGFDIIHGCNPPDLIFLVAWQFRLLGKRYLFDHHDINPELYEAKFARRDIFWRLLRLCEWLTFKSARTVISTNESYRAIALRRGGKSPRDIFVVRSGPDLSRVKAVPPDPALKRGRRFLVGYVGVMGEQEGIDLLLESIRYLVHECRREDIQFVLVGSGPSFAEMQRLTQRKEITDYVTFTGRAPDETLFSVLSTADVCVNPDRVNPMNDKSTMNKILEYMALGKPIVQFEMTEGRYSAREASLYAKPNDPIDFADKIVELLKDDEKRKHLGEFGRRRVQRELAWSYEAAKFIAAYNHVVRG